MPKAVRFDEYGGVDVLKVIDVPRPVPEPGQVLVQVKAAGINPGEAKIREGLMHARFPATFPSGEGSDLAGIVAATGPGVTGLSAGDEVIGFTNNRASHAQYVLAEAENLTPSGRRALGGGGIPVRDRGYGVRGGPGGDADRGRHGGRLGRGRGSRLDRGPAGPAGRGHGDRPGQCGQPRVAPRPRDHSGDLRRRRGRSDSAGRPQGGRLRRHVRRGRVRSRWTSASSQPASTRSPTSRPSRSTGSRATAALRELALACSPYWPGWSRPGN